ncbi:aromatic ring-hydroxylating dioxygenase subunit alpha [Sphingomonas sp. Ant20]|uniref:aromatic ring-hydroxylating dioxygenase subunit alpha n=1 Tax=Sphingomonas sp. Ant20 TaxID=104605 RepID=UPI000536DF7B|nr:aromatic ring-hydroxylating dioxygenase subunit alpha [Sphingomonas sp. Ant20]KHA64552.1 benzene 1,2-dioxygenase [Sphingomonas sp. Ant20]
MTNASDASALGAARTYTDADILAMVDEKAGKYDPKIYTDESLYRLELERIFARTWVCMGHETQIPKSGDFMTAYIGEDPVVVARQKDGGIRVFLNQCRHRGMRICRADSGNAKAFTCTYHGWAYNQGGDLVSVPMEQEAFGGCLNKADWGPKQARVETYKGLIFANWDSDAPALDEYLGDAKFYMDIMLDRCEAGTEAIPGIQKWVIPCNWKFPAEQFASDAYHAGTTSHLSGIMAGVPEDVDISQVAPPTEGLNVRMANGHGCGLFLRNPMFYMTILGPKVTQYLTAGPAYEEAVQRLGQNRADVNLCHCNVFPNLSFLAGINSVRMWQPRGPNEIEVWTFTLVDKSAPGEIKDEWRRHTSRTFSAGGVFEQDDGENWCDIQQVLHGHVAQQQSFNIEMATHTISNENKEGFPGDSFGYTYAEEAARGLYTFWTKIMTSPDWPTVQRSEPLLLAAE